MAADCAAPTREERDARRRATALARCKHWNGALGPKPCAIGVDLVKAVGPRVQTGWGRAIPCIDNPDPAFVCAMKVTPTAEDVDAQHREFRESAGRTLSVMASIPPGPPGSHGEVPCPKCGGAVWWQRSPTNGHLSGACPAGCVAFIQ